MTVRAGGVMADDGEKRVAAAAAVEPPSPPPSPPSEPLKEWAPLNHLMLQVPAKYQNLLVTGELLLTCVSAVDEYILLGTNTGSVYWYDAVSCTMQRYRAEGQVNAVCRVSAVTSVDHLLAAGHCSGDISVFLVPRLARGDVPEYVRIAERNIKKGLQFNVAAGHRAPVTALTWSQNAARLFSGDEDGVVAVSEIDYVTETVTCRVVLREPSAVVQLQYSRQTLLIATRGRSCLLTWPETTGAAGPRQVGTKPRKSPADLGACFVETEAGVTVLAARPSLKVVTADLQGQVSATISLKPTLETAGPVSLLYPVSVPVSDSGPGPGRLLPLWPGTVALYDSRTLLVVDVIRWEIAWCCDQLPAVLDLAVAGDAIFVLCSARRLIRLSQSPDTHPTVCENLRVANGDLSFDDVMQELRSAVPVNQVKTLLTSVQGQLGRSGLLDALSSRKEAVSSLTSRVSSLVAGRLGGAVTKDRPGPGISPASAGGPLRSTISSPDVREPDAPTETAAAVDTHPAASTATTATAATSSAMKEEPIAPAEEEPIARQVRPRRRPGRRRAARPGSGDARSLDTVSLGGDSVKSAGSGEKAWRRSCADEVGMSGRTDRAKGSAGSLVERPVESESRTVESEERTEEGTLSEQLTDAVPPEEPAASDGDVRTIDPSAAAVGITPGPLDFTQFYPHDVRPRLQRTDSELEEERRDKERRLAALLGLEDLSVPPPPPPPVMVASSGSSAAPSPPESGVERCQGLFGATEEAVVSTGSELAHEDSQQTKAEPEPSYHTLFPFDTKRTSPPRLPPPRPPSADSETGERRRHVVEVEHPDDPSPPVADPSPPPADPSGPSATPAAPSAGADPETATDPTELIDPPDWQPWQRHASPCYVMTLSACARYAVVTDPESRVFWSPATTSVTSWERLEYSACQMAVSWDGGRLWRLDETGAAYSLADPEPARPCGSHWVRAARDVIQLSADSAAVWYIKRGGKLFVQRDLSAHRCASPELAVDTPDPIIHVTARDGVVWAVTDKGSVLWRVGVSRAQLAGFSWESLSLGSLRARAAFLTAGELGWLVDDKGRLHLTGGVSASLPRGMDGVWRRVLAERSSSWPTGRQVAVMAPGAALRPSLAVEGDVAWLTDPGDMYVTTCRHHIIAVSWEQFVPRGREQEWAQVHADGLYQRRGQLWAVTARGQLYGGHGHDGDLQAVLLPERGCNVACVSAAPGTLWILTASGAVYVREGVEQRVTGTDWVPLDLLQMDRCRLVHLSVGTLSVWACDASGRVLVRLGPTVARRSAAGLQPAWVSLDQPPGVRFTLVCVGPADQPVWALDSAGVPWRRCGLSEQPVVGTHWQAAGGVSADRLALSPAGVWARARGTGIVHRWMEGAGQWCRVPGSTRHVSVSVSGELWVVHRGALYTLHEQTLRPGRCVVPRVTDRPTAPAEDEDRDWELVTY